MTTTLSDNDRKRLIKAVHEAKERAYCPYSHFRVGAALLTDGGAIIMGCNVENASYGGTICAERTAFVKAVSDGHKSFAALAVTTDVPSPISPCGLCRQVIREFCALDMPVFLVPKDYVDHDGTGLTGSDEAKVITMTVDQLLPMSFGPEHLPKSVQGAGGS